MNMRLVFSYLYLHLKAMKADTIEWFYSYFHRMWQLQQSIANKHRWTNFERYCRIIWVFWRFQWKKLLQNDRKKFVHLLWSFWICNWVDGKTIASRITLLWLCPCFYTLEVLILKIHNYCLTLRYQLWLEIHWP